MLSKVYTIWQNCKYCFRTISEEQHEQRWELLQIFLLFVLKLRNCKMIDDMIEKTMIYKELFVLILSIWVYLIGQYFENTSELYTILLFPNHAEWKETVVVTLHKGRTNEKGVKQKQELVLNGNSLTCHSGLQKQTKATSISNKKNSFFFFSLFCSNFLKGAFNF